MLPIFGDISAPEMKGVIGMSKLTKRSVEMLEPRGKDYLIWDTELSGFGVRVFARHPIS